MPVVGYLSIGSIDTAASSVAAFRQGPRFSSTVSAGLLQARGCTVEARRPCRHPRILSRCHADDWWPEIWLDGNDGT
jgi:hypothetical protein